MKNIKKIFINEFRIKSIFAPLRPVTNCKCFDTVIRSSIRKTRKLAGINANAYMRHIAVKISSPVRLNKSLSI